MQKRWWCTVPRWMAWHALRTCLMPFLLGTRRRALVEEVRQAGYEVVAQSADLATLRATLSQVWRNCGPLQG